MTTAKDSIKTAIAYDPTGIHQSELVYRTPLSSLLGLHAFNKLVHSIPSLPHALEFLVFLFGYAFNPVSIPLWMIAVSLTGVVVTDMPPPDTLRYDYFVFAPIYYLATVLVTLIGTEVAKASFRATRPEAVLSAEFRASKLRRYGTLVASLKSKHSFPSGDSAQAANAVLFWFHFIAPLLLPEHQQHMTIINIFAFGIFYPGVAFARIFYHCHWIEDCLGGALLAATLHKTVMPYVYEFVLRQVPYVYELLFQSV
ncbi:expressed unknown protein [Seminavis robusta]|uniref:Phosphatidic acid phosphatase type 2/haloperoxidase domain-containing protein n=1 Tax=Seminavis robusta TaxID=568900 RepID=A0A9N8HTB6_9STRA|nr:expressed unknown protein [Seminavis robusta]|eukprot:Sro1558_g282350.1 n/a (255) ;mRNA; r:9185-9949